MNTLFIPILLGTTRPGRESEKVAKFITSVGQEIPTIRVLLVDPLNFNFPYDGNDVTNQDPKYSKITKDADGFL